MKENPEKSLIEELDETIRHRMQTQGPPAKEENPMYKALEYFVSIDGIMGKTEVTPALRNIFYMYQVMDKKHPKWGLDTAAKELALIVISQEGKSRRGMIELWRGLLSQMRQESVSLEVGKPGNESPAPRK